MNRRTAIVAAALLWAGGATSALAAGDPCFAPQSAWTFGGIENDPAAKRKFADLVRSVLPKNAVNDEDAGRAACATGIRTSTDVSDRPLSRSEIVCVCAEHY